eukprot:8903706-Heterocapsa_arctica.AAC.1
MFIFTLVVRPLGDLRRGRARRLDLRGEPGRERAPDFAALLRGCNSYGPLAELPHRAGGRASSDDVYS